MEKMCLYRLIIHPGLYAVCINLLKAYLAFSYFLKTSLPVSRINILSSVAENFSSVYNVGILSNLYKYFIGS